MVYRYSYCFNNPLKYTDPSGYLISASGSRARMGSYLRRHGYSQVDIWMMESDPFMGPTLDYENSGCGGGGGMGYGTSFYETFVRPTQHPDFTSIKKHDGQYGYWVREYVDNNGYIVYPKGLKGDGIVPEISICERFIPITSPSGGEASLAGELFLSGAKGFGVGMEHSPGSIRLSNGSGISPKYYSSGWTGGSRARITTYNLSAWGGRIAKGSIAASAGFGAYHIYNGYQEDGGTYGINAQVATGQAVGGIAGGWGGAMGGAAAGAAICAWFGGVGAVPGAIIGGIIGGIVGGWGGSELGGAAVLQIHR